jgi:hypothetical protein
MCPLGFILSDTLPFNEYVTLIWSQDQAHDMKQGGLSGTIRPHQGIDFSPFNRKMVNGQDHLSVITVCNAL